jgi:two-component system LytT family sensor kinase
MKNFFTGSKIQIFLHLLAWAILLGLPLYFFKRWEVGKDFIWLYYVSNIISGMIFYINYLVLVPKFFFEMKRHKYYISVIMLLVFFYFVSNGANELVFRYIPGRDRTEDNRKIMEEARKPGPPAPGIILGRPPFRQIHVINYGFTSLFLVFFSMGLRVLERHTQTERMQKELEREKLNSELAFLKNQISPHFFFNTLNNIYSLISINAEDSKKAILKLSKLMRYLLYESEQGNTRLSNEIDFMNNYIDLMKLRMSEKINLSVIFPDKYNDLNVPPLLFIPFIENAFKHGISYREKSFIDISLIADRDLITFSCINSLIKSREEAESTHSGIGLENVSKRLNLLFPGQHDLKINKSDTSFEVVLKIKFTS